MPQNSLAKRSLHLICLIFLFAILVFTTTSNVFARTPHLKVGIILPLSGPWADYGAATVSGIKLAREATRIDSQVEFIFEDSQYDPKIAVSAFQKLLSIDRIDLVFVWGTGPAQAIAPLAEAKQIPILAVTSETSFGVGKQYVFRFGTSSEGYALALIHHIRKQGYKRVAVLTDEIAFFTEILGAFHQLANQDESFIEVASFSPSETDFKSALLKLKRQKFDALAVFVTSSQLTPFFTQMQQLNIQIPVIGTSTFDSREDIKRVGKYMNGAIFSTFSVSPGFHQSYVAQFKNDIQLPYAAGAHDFVLLMKQLTADATEPTTSEQLLKKLKNAQPFTGATGKIQLVKKENGSAEFAIPVMLQQVTETGVKPLY